MRAGTLVVGFVVTLLATTAAADLRLVAPQPGETGVRAEDVVFSWEGAGMRAARLAISQDPGFPAGTSTMRIRLRPGATSYALGRSRSHLRRVARLADTGGGRVYWRVESAGDGPGAKPEASAPRALYLAGVSLENLTPTWVERYTNPAAVTFTWEATGATATELQVSAQQDFPMIGPAKKQTVRVKVAGGATTATVNGATLAKIQLLSRADNGWRVWWRLVGRANAGATAVASDPWPLLLNHPNAPIGAYAGADVTNAGFRAQVTLDGGGSRASAGGGALTYHWRQVYGTPVDLSDAAPNKPTVTFTTPPANSGLDMYWYLSDPAGAKRARRGLDLKSWRVVAFARPQKVLVFELHVEDANTRDFEEDGEEEEYYDAVDRVTVYLDSETGSEFGIDREVVETSAGHNVVPVGFKTYLSGPASEGDGTDWSATSPAPNGTNGTNDAVTGWLWTMTAKPAGSVAEIANPTSQTPYFVPDVPGVYTFRGEVTAVGDIPADFLDTNGDGRRGGDNAITDAPKTFNVVAANYVGAGTIGGATPNVVGQCGSCHAAPVVAPSDGRTIPAILPLWSETAHAKCFSQAYDGVPDDRFADPACMHCHTVGHDLSAAARNGGFDDVARTAGLTWPSEVTHGNFTRLLAQYPTVAQKTNVQCENCHGPGSEHGGNAGDPTKIGLSWWPSVCQQCHMNGMNEEEKRIGLQYRNSRHGYDVHIFGSALGSSGREACQRCHSAQGFARQARGDAPTATDIANPARLGCQTCHDPHNAANPNQLRVAPDSYVKVLGGNAWVKGGKGSLCMNCHRMPLEEIENPAGVKGYIEAYVRGDTQFPDARPISDTFRYPSTMLTNAEMLGGVGGYEFDGERYDRSFHYAVPDTCVTCHMGPSPEEGEEGYLEIGGHTFMLESTANRAGNRINDPPAGEEVKNLKACEPCHAGIDAFNRRARGDYDGDGYVEGVSNEVKGLLAVLKAAPGYPTGSPAVTRASTLQQAAAYWNVTFVERDISNGRHNTGYAVTLLQRSYKQLTGVEVPGADIR